MTAPAYIWQIVLNQGGGRPSYRRDVTEAALVVTRPLLDLSEPQAVDGLGLVQVKHLRRGALVTISDRAGPRAAVGIAGHGRISAPLWRTLHEAVPGASLATDPAAPPAAPWCGLVLADQMRDRPRDEVTDLIVQARVLGWAWMEREA
ncbi:hypothetical protein [Methylobacterium gossipiicola]|uniref:Uncharacterized protein n=1 Tax=Methylobacterium gossipiicola TaxID=582675 RepID=A0A1I2UQH8_9HYPH|nr:hypothetical protein [Methylobacterium gossipiicola]SFG79343.1 hypothetical protein SAMN05192565_11196 [Methylobacterium gossipiicola]